MKNGIFLTAAAFALSALTAAAQAPAPPPPPAAGDAQVRTSQIQVKQRKFDYNIKDGTNQLNFAKNRYLAGRRDLCENNLILSQFRVDMTLNLMRGHPDEIANLRGFFILQADRDRHFKNYTEYNRQVYALQDEIRLFAERNGPFAAFTYYINNVKAKVVTGDPDALQKIFDEFSTDPNKRIDVDKLRETIGGPAPVPPVANRPGPPLGRPSQAELDFFTNPSNPAFKDAFIQQAIASGLPPAVANQLAAAYAASDIRTVAQIAAQYPNSVVAQRALAALLQRLGVANGLQQLGMTSEDAQAADAAFRGGDIAALERLKEKYRDNPAVVAALNTLINQLRSGGPLLAVLPPGTNGSGIRPVAPPSDPNLNPVPNPNPAPTPQRRPADYIPKPDVDKVYDAKGNLVDIWSGGADPTEGTRAVYEDEKAGRISSEMRLTRKFIERPGGGYTMQESEDASSQVEWSLRILAKPDGGNVTYEILDAANPGAKFDVLAWYDPKGQRVASSNRQFTTTIPGGKFTIAVEGKTKTFKNGSPFKIKIEGGQ